MSKYIDLIALNRALVNLKVELEKGTSTKYTKTSTVEASNKLAPSASIVVTNAEGTQTKKLFDGTKDITITATEMGVNTKAEDITLLDKKVSKVTGKKLSTEDYSTVDKNKLIGIEANANNYTHPETHPASMVVETASKRFVTDADKTNWSNKYTKVETDNVLETALGSIIWKAAVATFEDIATTYPEPQDGWVVNVNDTDITYRYTGTAWIAISANAIPVATTTVDGKMSKEDKTKIDGIEVGANSYVHPENHPASMITQKSTHRFVTDAEKTTYSDKDTKSEFDTKALTKVDIANVATVEEVDALFDGLFPKPPKSLIITLNRVDAQLMHLNKMGRSVKEYVEPREIDLNKCLKSWTKATYKYASKENGTDYVISNGIIDPNRVFSGDIIEIEDAVLYDSYDEVTKKSFGLAFTALIDEQGGPVLATFMSEISGYADASNCTSMFGAFGFLTSLEKADLSSWRFNNLKNIEYVFSNCINIRYININGWDTSKVESMGGLFEDTRSLEILEMKGVTYESVTDLSSMFGGSGLTEIYIPNLNPTNVQSVWGMFYGMPNLIKLSMPNFENSGSFSNIMMFVMTCPNLEILELPVFNIDNFTDLDDYLSECPSIKTIDMSGSIITNESIRLLVENIEYWGYTGITVKVSSEDKHAGVTSPSVTFVY